MVGLGALLQANWKLILDRFSSSPTEEMAESLPTNGPAGPGRTARSRAPAGAMEEGDNAPTRSPQFIPVSRQPADPPHDYQKTEDLPATFAGGTSVEEATTPAHPTKSRRGRDKQGEGATGQAARQPAATTSGTGILFTNQAPDVTTDDAPTPSPAATTGTSGSGTVGTTPLTCSSNVGGGSHGAPQTVELSCSAAADLLYCVQSGGGCCTPNTLYTGSFTMGAVAGNYCLSFQGSSSGTGLVSTEVQLDMTFGPGIPDLDVTIPKKFLQTGQLPGLTTLTSNDFGNVGHDAGVINLFTHDPSPLGENLSCSDIVENHASLASPTPTEVVTATSVAAFTPATALEVTLEPLDLAYGDNYLTAYLINAAYAPTQYACTTHKLRLEDFEFFHADPMAQATSGGSVLVGGLQSTGFFEPAHDLYREPAGSMVQQKQEQELRTGMVGIFY